MNTFKRGDQVAYIPNHAEGDITHRDVELGFVTSINDKFVFVRYWSKTSPHELRTKANSEATPSENLVHRHSHPQQTIENILEKL